MSITSVFGKKLGSSTVNEFDNASLEKAVRRSEEVAKLAPENVEYLPIPGPQKYLESNGFLDSTAKLDPTQRANLQKTV